MKSPREILLNRHAGARADLDAARRHAIQALLTPEPTPPWTGRVRAVWQTLWAGRWQLAPLAALWLLVGGLGLATDPQPIATAAAAPGHHPQESLLSALEARRLLLEWIEPAAEAHAEAHKNTLSPRTERRAPRPMPQTC